ncbi:unnamed protein product [Clonostachys rosea f. rosea IK726]|uniref:Choline transport protein n=2 Tax=Bionectria ochroleuca TaxID=29856 RepID=A0A0B7KH62_BIOOC|nr:unnamed protein product [Clonostachys rosea f. rosea IK726]
MGTFTNEKSSARTEKRPIPSEDTIAIPESRINASGHNDQLSRQYGLLEAAGMAVTINNAWVVLGSSISVSLLNGGPPGVIFGLIVAVFYYSFIGMSLAEFASSFPSAGGVYHWATIAAGPSWGRVTGFFTGWLNFYGSIFGLASLVQIAANAGVQLYAIYNPAYAVEAWHVYIAYLVILLFSTLLVLFANRLAPYSQHLGLFLVVFGGIATIIVLATMPSEHSSNDFVWTSFNENNLSGWEGGVAFMIGVLNGAFTIGTTDVITHMAEEMKNPERDLPKAIFLQIGIGGAYGLAYAVALAYAISDITALDAGVNNFPLAGIYRQATGSPAATFGLLFIIFLSVVCSVIGSLLSCSRTYWALARDNAVPLSGVFRRVNETLSCPLESTLFVAVVTTAIGAIPIASSVGFSNLTGSFIILSTVSYAIPMVANLATGRKYFTKGPFSLPGLRGYAINSLAIVFIVLFDVFFCFPLALPFDVTTMNYNCVILAGVLVITALWWLVHATKHYPGPMFKDIYVHEEETQSEKN